MSVLDELHQTIADMVDDKRGILAADESAGTIKKRFDAINVESSEENRRYYRSMLLSTEGLGEYISGNMGIPLVLFAFGEAMLQAAVVLFIIEMLLHFTLGLYMLDHRTNLLKLLRMPMIIASFLGILFSVLHIELAEPIANTIKLLGQVAIPLLLFSLGVRLLDVNLKDWKQGMFGAVTGPLAGIVSAMMVMPFIELDPIQKAVLLVFAALPPAVLNVLVSEQYQQEPERVASIVMLGNLASVVIIPAVLWFVLI